MRAATRKRTDEHRAEMAARAERRDMRRRRRIGLLAGQAMAREMAWKLRDAAAGVGLDGEDVKPCVPVDCSQPEA